MVPKCFFKCFFGCFLEGGLVMFDLVGWVDVCFLKVFKVFGFVVFGIGFDSWGFIGFGLVVRWLLMV